MVCMESGHDIGDGARVLHDSKAELHEVVQVKSVTLHVLHSTRAAGEGHGLAHPSMRLSQHGSEHPVQHSRECRLAAPCAMQDASQRNAPRGSAQIVGTCPMRNSQPACSSANQIIDSATRAVLTVRHGVIAKRVLVELRAQHISLQLPHELAVVLELKPVAAFAAEQVC